MRKSTALRILALLPLLPAGLADLVCYDIASPMHPEILIPVENCWCHHGATFLSKYSSNEKDGNGPAPPPMPASSRPKASPVPSYKQGNPSTTRPTSPTAGSNTSTHDQDYSDDDDDNNHNPSSPAGSSHPTQSSSPSSYDDDVNLPFFSFAPDSPVQQILNSPALPPPDWKSPNQVFFNVDCGESQTTCDGVTQTLNAAGCYISQIIQFKNPIIVNASLVDFCAQYKVCNFSAGVDTVLGGAVPTRTFPLIDDDDVVRYYPQASVRQMSFPKGESPQFASCEILMEFNSKANFFFLYPNTTTIQSDQYDFLTVALHELMHGLGFMSGWGEYFQTGRPTCLTPQVVVGNPTSQSGIQFEGFVEYAYDRAMYLVNNNIYATNLTAEMITRFNNLGIVFNDSITLGSAFASSPAYELGIYMDGNATTPDSIQQSLCMTNSSQAILQSNYTVGPPITLETSFSPFASGSSINHVDHEMYLNTADFLMRYSTPVGKTLQDFVDAYGTSADSNYGAIGPGLRYILAGIGYRIRGGIPMGGSVPNNGSNSGTTSSANSTSDNTSDAVSVQMGGQSMVWICIYCGILWSWLLFG